MVASITRNQSPLNFLKKKKHDIINLIHFLVFVTDSLECERLTLSLSLTWHLVVMEIQKHWAPQSYRNKENLRQNVPEACIIHLVYAIPSHGYSLV
jgi:hypothetical protein